MLKALYGRRGQWRPWVRFKRSCRSRGDLADGLRRKRRSRRRQDIAQTPAPGVPLWAPPLANIDTTGEVLCEESESASCGLAYSGWSSVDDRGRPPGAHTPNALPSEAIGVGEALRVPDPDASGGRRQAAGVHHVVRPAPEALEGLCAAALVLRSHSAGTVLVLQRRSSSTALLMHKRWGRTATLPVRWVHKYYNTGTTETCYLPYTGTIRLLHWHCTRAILAWHWYYTATAH